MKKIISITLCVLLISLSTISLQASGNSEEIWIDSVTHVVRQVSETSDNPIIISGTSNCTLDSTAQSNLAATLLTPITGITTAATPDVNGNCNGATFVVTPVVTAPTPTPTVNNFTSLSHGLASCATAVPNGTSGQVALCAATVVAAAVPTATPTP